MKYSHTPHCRKALGRKGNVRYDSSGKPIGYHIKPLVSDATHIALCVCNHPKKNAHGVKEKVLSVCKRRIRTHPRKCHKYQQLIAFFQTADIESDPGGYEQHVVAFDHLDCG